MSKRGFQALDIGLLRRVVDPQLSPCGSQVVFGVIDPDLKINDYRSSIWISDTDLGEGRPTPFVDGNSLSLARWSPDGTLLAFVDESEGVSQICTLPTKRSGERIIVTTVVGKISELAWSPDGTRLAFVSRDTYTEQGGSSVQSLKAKDMPARKIDRLRYRMNGVGWTSDRPSRIYVVEVYFSSQPRLLTEGPFDAQGLSWSPFGEEICFISARHTGYDLDLCNDIWVMELVERAEPRLLTATDKAYSLPSWSPDGSQIAYVYNPTPTESPRHLQIGVIDLQSGVERTLSASLDRTCSPFGTSRPPLWRDKILLFGVEDHGNVSLYQVNTATDEVPRLVQGGDRWISDWSCKGDKLVYVSSSATALDELKGCLLLETNDLNTLVVGPEYSITSFSKSLLKGIELIEPIRYLATSKDGTEVECWAIPPRGRVQGDTYPTLLNVHGGPFTQFGNHLFDEFQLQSAAGFGVVYCNPRGSSGYSEEWGRAIRWPECESDPGSGWGSVDFEDVMACVDEAVACFDWVDGTRLGVIGGSYGGYMASWVVGHTDRFRAACSERACNNLLTMEHSADISGFVRSYVGRNHLDDPDLYLRNSPVSFVKEIKSPVLIIHSEEDLRCPINQAEELYVALKLLGQHVDMFRFPGENHELSRSGAPMHRVERAGIILSWFKEHL